MIRPEIHFHMELPGFQLDEEEKLKKWLCTVVRTEKQEVALLNYIFCSDDYLLGINQEYLGHDYFTDILSFPLKSDPIEGDIFISVDRVKENALEYNVVFFAELSRVMVHGLLHFLGYDDHTAEDIAAMRAKENEYIGLLKLE